MKSDNYMITPQCLYATGKASRWKSTGKPDMCS